MCCNKTLDQNTNTQKMKHFQQNSSSMFSTWHLAGSDIINLLMLKSHQLDIWPHLLLPQAKLSYDSCDSYLMIAVTAFPDSRDSFFRTNVIVDSATLKLLFFPLLAKNQNQLKKLSFSCQNTFFFCYSFPSSSYPK